MKMKAACLWIALSFVALISRGQNTSSAIDRRDLKRIVAILTSDSLEGRAVGSEGFKRASNFLAASFQRLSLHGFDSTGFLQPFLVRQFYLGQIYLSTPTHTLYNFDSMVFQGSNYMSAEKEVEIIFGGTGSERELDKLEVRNRMVLAFVNNLRSTYALSRSLYKRGAIGLIAANPDNSRQFESIRLGFKDYALQKRYYIPSRNALESRASRFFDTLRMVNKIIIPNEMIRHVGGTSLQNLKAIQKSGKLEASRIIRAKTRAELLENEVETCNVVGAIKGTTNKSIVISAHYDHLGKIDGQLHRGADDNASGIAALIELAEAYAERTDLQYNLVFLATTGEEGGLWGSRHFVEHSSLQPDSIICNLNLDMIGRVDDKHLNGKYLYCIGASKHASLDKFIRRADQQFEECSIDFSLDDPGDFTGLFTRSDHYSFHRKGIPAVHFFSGFHDDYHKDSDTLDKIDFKALEHRVKLISTLIDLILEHGFAEQ